MWAGPALDVSMLENGLPELCSEGAVVGGWQTKVKAIRMETSAMGGDSHVWVKNMKINIGPAGLFHSALLLLNIPVFSKSLKKEEFPEPCTLKRIYSPQSFS